MCSWTCYVTPIKRSTMVAMQVLHIGLCLPASSSQARLPACKGQASNRRRYFFISGLQTVAITDIPLLQASLFYHFLSLFVAAPYACRLARRGCDRGALVYAANGNALSFLYAAPCVLPVCAKFAMVLGWKSYRRGNVRKVIVESSSLGIYPYTAGWRPCNEIWASLYKRSAHFANGCATFCLLQLPLSTKQLKKERKKNDKVKSVAACCGSHSQIYSKSQYVGFAQNSKCVKSLRMLTFKAVSSVLFFLSLTFVSLPF